MWERWTERLSDPGDPLHAKPWSASYEIDVPSGKCYVGLRDARACYYAPQVGPAHLANGPTVPGPMDDELRADLERLVLGDGWRREDITFYAPNPWVPFKDGDEMKAARAQVCAVDTGGSRL